jgi:carbamate kinase
VTGRTATTRTTTGEPGAVERNWGTAEARIIREGTPAELRQLSFESGSMGPKIEAAGGIAAIGALDAAATIVRGASRTRVVPARDADRGD